VWNEELKTLGGASYLKGPWLYVECYMYQRIHNILSRTQHWKNYDVFKRQKDSTFIKSKAAIVELAARYRELLSEMKHGITYPEARRLLFVSPPFKYFC
jgi:damage-control phosphatase, subfamily III